jgi:shikimate kinase
MIADRDQAIVFEHNRRHGPSTHSPMDFPQQKRNLVFLTGFMGSGKSTIGPILANALGWDFVDIDRAIEEKTKEKIVDIFAVQGEQLFRGMEREALGELVARNGCVVSLGGGTLTTQENLEFVRQNGIIIYLQLSPEEILHRVKFRTDRPMLKGPDGEPLEGEELKKRVEGLLGAREQYYSKADIIIPADTLNVGSTVDAIVKKLRGLIH